MGSQNSGDPRGLPTEATGRRHDQFSAMTAMLRLDQDATIVGTGKNDGAPFATRLSAQDRMDLDWWARFGGVPVSVVGRMILRFGLQHLEEARQDGRKRKR